MTRSYQELITIPDFLERYKYLKIGGKVGDETFGYNRYLNQIFYTSPEWRRFRKFIIDRDKACDLGCEGHDIYGKHNIVIHHINPMTLEDIYKRNPMLLDPDNCICVSAGTHKAIHYGDESLLPIMITERKANDTVPWKL